MKAHPPIPQVWGKGRCLRLYGCYILIAHDPLALEARLNLYAYAGNNPVSNVDATGLYFTSDGTHIPNFDNLSNPLLGLSTTVNSYNPQSPLWYQDT